MPNRKKSNKDESPVKKEGKEPSNAPNEQLARFTQDLAIIRKEYKQGGREQELTVLEMANAELPNDDNKYEFLRVIMETMEATIPQTMVTQGSKLKELLKKALKEQNALYPLHEEKNYQRFEAVRSALIRGKFKVNNWFNDDKSLYSKFLTQLFTKLYPAPPSPNFKKQLDQVLNLYKQQPATSDSSNKITESSANDKRHKKFNQLLNKFEEAKQEYYILRDVDTLDELETKKPDRAVQIRILNTAFTHSTGTKDDYNLALAIMDVLSNSIPESIHSELKTKLTDIVKEELNKSDGCRSYYVGINNLKDIINEGNGVLLRSWFGDQGKLCENFLTQLFNKSLPNLGGKLVPHLLSNFDEVAGKAKSSKAKADSVPEGADTKGKDAIREQASGSPSTHSMFSSSGSPSSIKQEEEALSPPLG